MELFLVPSTFIIPVCPEWKLMQHVTQTWQNAYNWFLHLDFTLESFFWLWCSVRGLSHASAYIHMQYVHLQPSVFIFLVRNGLFDKDLHSSQYSPVSGVDSVSGRFAENLALALLLLTLHVQRPPDLSSQSSLSMLKLLEWEILKVQRQADRGLAQTWENTRNCLITLI